MPTGNHTKGDAVLAQLDAQALATLLDYSSAYVYIINRQTLLIEYINKTAQQRFHAQADGRTTCYKAIFGRSSQCPWCPIRQIKDGTFFKDLFVPDTRQWFNFNMHTTTLNGEEVVASYVRDVTQLKSKELQFDKTLQELLVVNPKALCAFRLNLTKNTCSIGHGSSEYIKKLLQADTVDEVLSKIESIITDPQDVQTFRQTFNREHLLQCYKKGQDRLNFTYHRLTESGDTHWVTSYFKILQNPYTGEVEAIAYSVDADETKKKEAILHSLTKQEYDFIALFNVFTKAVSFFSAAENITGFNPVRGKGYVKNVQLAADEILWQHPRDKEAYLQNMALVTVLAKLNRTGEYVFSYTCQDEQGRQHKKQVSFHYLNKDRHDIVFARADITAAFEQELANAQKLQEATRAAQQANRKTTDFLANMSHDMRTPLNGILGYSKLALEEKTGAAKDVYLQKINQAGNTLFGLIDDMLDLQRIENGTIKLEPAPVSCSTVVKTIVTAVQPSLDAKKIHFTIDNSRAVMASINIDLVRVSEIFINLLSNAVKFTPEGGKVDFIIICDKLEPHCVHDRLIVRDNGIGISKEFLPRIYEPLTQERTAATAHIGGSGLGMSIVKRLVDLMGGRISIKSELGKGTEVTVCLDLERSKTAPADDTTVKVTGDLQGLHIMVCEDNPMNKEIVTKILEHYGAAVTVCNNGQDGVEKFASLPEGSLDVILMDLRMPVLDGYAATKQIRSLANRDAKTIPIIALSADAYSSDRKKALAAGMNSHLAKPIDTAKMIAEIRRLVPKK
ncbi:MAG: ATP-binding protein [Acidaminococcaceae bacterium]|nr:ATP-binding protein [Acidaminococcaceae bacterium]